MDQNDDHTEVEFPRLLEPENLVPLIVIPGVAGVIVAYLALHGGGWFF
jgi:hypothetical protein